MKNLGTVLPLLYPTASPEDFAVRDDGAGPFIERWNEAVLGSRPSLSALLEQEPATLEKVAALRKIAEIEAQITPRRLREAVLTQAGKDWLTARDDEIKAERVRL